MRLSYRTQAVIRDTAREIFGGEAEVLLFGSRTDDSLRGGDINLLVKLPQSVEDGQRKALTLTARLQRRLGDQRIDVLVLDPEMQQRAIHREALNTGIVL